MVYKHFANSILKQAWAHFTSQLNGFKHCYLIPIILYTFNHLFTHSLVVAQSAGAVEYTDYTSAEG